MISVFTRSLAPALLLLLATACAGEESPSADAPPTDEAAPPAAVERLPSLDRFVREGLRPIGSTRPEITQRLGEPDSLLATSVPNRHDPSVQDTLLALHYPDLVVHIHRPGGGRDLLSDVEVTDDRYLRHPILGATREEVEAAFGPPHEVRDGVWSYDCATCGEADSPVEILFADDRVRKVRFTYYVD